GGRPLNLYVVHFKSMSSRGQDGDGRLNTMPVREAEARAVRRIIEDRFGAYRTSDKNFVICGDMNDYQEKIKVSGSRRSGFHFEYVREERSALDVFSSDGFAHNPVLRRDKLDRWTLYHSRGPQEQHLCQLD